MDPTMWLWLAIGAGEHAAARVHALQALEPQPGAFGIHRQRGGVCQGRELFLQPGAPAEARQFAQQVLLQRQQVAHIVQRVFDLFVRERPAGPVGACVGLWQFTLEDPPDELGVADLGGESRERGGDLGVEDPGQRPGDGGEHLEVLPRGMQDLDGPVAGHQAAHRVEFAQRDGVDADGSLR